MGKGLWSCLLDLVYPRICAVCDSVLEAEESFICKKCLSDMPLTFFWSWRENPAEKKLWGRTYLQSVSSLFFYRREGEYKRLIHKLKYSGNAPIGEYLGQMLGSYMLPHINDIDLVVPVPLHWKKKWKRGYNQSESIARGIGCALGKEVVCGALIRKKYTKSQTTITMGSKWENIQGSFEVKRKDLLKDKHIVIVDDVLTSGATIEACWNELVKIDNIKVSVATLAYVE